MELRLRQATRIQRRRRLLALGLFACIAAFLACDVINSITANPVFTCASSTPRPTDTPLPTALPTYPWIFVANVDHSNYLLLPGQSYGTVNVQYMAQSAGTIQIDYVGYDIYNNIVLNSGGFFAIAIVPVGVPGIYGSWPVVLPSNVIFAYIYLTDSAQGQLYNFTVFPSTSVGSPNPPPCCLAPPIYPTPVPTFTPYPTPTLYALTNNFYLGDTFYTSGTTARIGVTLTGVSEVWPNPDDMALMWTLQLTNIGGIEYDFYPYFQAYASEVAFANGSVVDSVWPSSLALANQLGIPISVLPIPIQPGQTQSFTFVTDGFALGDRLNRVAFVLNPIQSNGASPTLVPGSDIVQFLTQLDPFCRVQIASPTVMATIPTATPTP